MLLFFVATLIIALLFEGTLTTLPLVLILLLCLTILKREAIVFPIAFVVGIFLDILTVRFIGLSSLFFIVFLFLILLYQRKYEINSYPFVLAASFFGSVGYLLLFEYGRWFWQAALNSILALVVFALLKFFNKDLKYTSKITKL